MLHTIKFYIAYFTFLNLQSMSFLEGQFNAEVEVINFINYNPWIVKNLHLLFENLSFSVFCYKFKRIIELAFFSELKGDN